MPCYNCVKHEGRRVLAKSSRKRRASAAWGVQCATQMRLRGLCLTVFTVSALSLSCNDTVQTYPPIIIYGDPNVGNANGGSGLTGSGNSSSSAGSNNGPSGGMSSGGGSGGNDLYAHCGSLWSGDAPPVGKVSCDLDALEDGGELTGDVSTNKTLSSGHSYKLKGPVRVLPGVTLTVEPCVKVIGQSSDAVLAVLAGPPGKTDDACSYSTSDGKAKPGGTLIAIGEPMAPIVFTSAKEKGKRTPGDWGGLILMGNAQNNLALSDDGGKSGNRVPIEGLLRTECHGWPTTEFNTESSGKLEYVRIEYASKRLVMDNETNGLTLASLGSGTEMHYVMVANSADDCFEWFGGAMNADHLIALNCEDDMFDGDNGFSGKLQFLFGRQYPTTTELDSRGFEIDGAPSQYNLPFTSESVSNFTLCGGGALDMNKSRDGAVLRKFAGDVSLMNGIVTGFAGSGLFVQNLDGTQSASMTFVNLFGNAAGIAAGKDATPANGTNGAVSQGWFLQQEGNSTADPDRFCDCWANPPVPVSASTSPGKAPTGFSDETAGYVGAFKDSSADSNWMRGAWVDWSSN